MLKINGKTITGVVYKGKRIERIMVGGKKYYDMHDGKIIGNALEAGSIRIDGKTYSYGAGYFELNIGELSGWSLDSVFSSKKISTITHIGIDTRRITDVRQMFLNCKSLTELNLHGFDTRMVTNMYRMFNESSNLTNLDFGDKFDTQNVTNMDGMFKNCAAITELNLGDNFNVGKVTNVDGMFYLCSALQTITGCLKNLCISLSLSACPLDHDSAMRIINGLATVTTAQTLALSPKTKDTLSATEKAILINKGWTLA